MAWVALCLAWWWVPILLLILISFGARTAVGEPTGLTLDPYRSVLRSDDLRPALEQSIRLASLTVLIAVPIASLLAYGLFNWRGPGAGAAGATVILALATPQTVLAAALFLMIVTLTPWLRFGTPAELAAHVTLAIPFVTAVVWVGLAGIGTEQSEIAMDLGATPVSALTRVVAPQTTPALLAGAAIAFLLSFDNIVLSQWLCIQNACKTIPVQLFAARGAVRVNPSVSALGTMGMGVVAVVGLVAGLTVRRLAKRLR